MNPEKEQDGIDRLLEDLATTRGCTNVTRKQAQNVLGHLKEQYKKLFNLHYVEGLTVDQIAKQLQQKKREETVENLTDRVERGVRTLLQKVENELKREKDEPEKQDWMPAVMEAVTTGIPGVFSAQKVYDAIEQLRTTWNGQTTVDKILEIAQSNLEGKMLVVRENEREDSNELFEQLIGMLITNELKYTDGSAVEGKTLKLIVSTNFPLCTDEEFHAACQYFLDRVKVEGMNMQQRQHLSRSIIKIRTALQEFSDDIQMFSQTPECMSSIVRPHIDDIVFLTLRMQELVPEETMRSIWNESPEVVDARIVCAQRQVDLISEYFEKLGNATTDEQESTQVREESNEDNILKEVRDVTRRVERHSAMTEVAAHDPKCALDVLNGLSSSEKKDYFNQLLTHVKEGGDIHPEMQAELASVIPSLYTPIVETILSGAPKTINLPQATADDLAEKVYIGMKIDPARCLQEVENLCSMSLLPHRNDIEVAVTKGLFKAFTEESCLFELTYTEHPKLYKKMVKSDVSIEDLSLQAAYQITRDRSRYTPELSGNEYHLLSHGAIGNVAANKDIHPDLELYKNEDISQIFVFVQEIKYKRDVVPVVEELLRFPRTREYLAKKLDIDVEKQTNLHKVIRRRVCRRPEDALPHIFTQIKKQTHFLSPDLRQKLLTEVGSWNPLYLQKMWQEYQDGKWKIYLYPTEFMALSLDSLSFEDIMDRVDVMYRNSPGTQEMLRLIIQEKTSTMSEQELIEKVCIPALRLSARPHYALRKRSRDLLYTKILKWCSGWPDKKCFRALHETILSTEDLLIEEMNNAPLNTDMPDYSVRACRLQNYLDALLLEAQYGNPQRAIEGVKKILEVPNFSANSEYDKKEKELVRIAYTAYEAVHKRKIPVEEIQNDILETVESLFLQSWNYKSEQEEAQDSLEADKSPEVTYIMNILLELRQDPEELRGPETINEALNILEVPPEQIKETMQSQDSLWKQLKRICRIASKEERVAHKLGKEMIKACEENKTLRLFLADLPSYYWKIAYECGEISMPLPIAMNENYGETLATEWQNDEREVVYVPIPEEEAKRMPTEFRTQVQSVRPGSIGLLNRIRNYARRHSNALAVMGTLIAAGLFLLATWRDNLEKSGRRGKNTLGAKQSLSPLSEEDDDRGDAKKVLELSEVPDVQNQHLIRSFNLPAQGKGFERREITPSLDPETYEFLRDAALNAEGSGTKTIIAKTPSFERGEKVILPYPLGSKLPDQKEAKDNEDKGVFVSDEPALDNLAPKHVKLIFEGYLEYTFILPTDPYDIDDPRILRKKGWEVLADMPEGIRKASLRQLSPDIIQRLAPKLWETVEKAKTQNCVEATKTLQKAVREFMTYAGDREYRKFLDQTETPGDDRHAVVEHILKTRRGKCAASSALLNELLCQAEIPNLTVGCLLADEKELTTYDSHATNMVFMPIMKDGRTEYVPVIVDATPSRREELEAEKETISQNIPNDERSHIYALLLALLIMEGRKVLRRNNRRQSSDQDKREAETKVEAQQARQDNTDEKEDVEEQAFDDYMVEIDENINDDSIELVRTKRHIIPWKIATEFAFDTAIATLCNRLTPQGKRDGDAVANLDAILENIDQVEHVVDTALQKYGKIGQEIFTNHIRNANAYAIESCSWIVAFWMYSMEVNQQECDAWIQDAYKRVREDVGEAAVIASLSETLLKHVPLGGKQKEDLNIVHQEALAVSHGIQPQVRVENISAYLELIGVAFGQLEHSYEEGLPPSLDQRHPEQG